MKYLYFKADMSAHGKESPNDFWVAFIIESCIIELGRSYSSAGEHFLDVEGVVGSIPTNFTIFFIFRHLFMQKGSCRAFFFFIFTLECIKSVEDTCDDGWQSKDKD